ncbi:metallophosphoesterase family protein [Sciscionella sediminilitoris]|uniref:metallophosphoesterase family protein n=1 Tax=Sciscionella sediminilitoris TaxID=1445613 RepID=UPI0004DEFEE9|nr:metallophosphoesterase [Sciscionella sp. SE31]
MRVHVVSDVHGNVDALSRAGEGADVLLVLGDLLDFVDYHDHSAGILGVIFGAEAVGRFAELRRRSDPTEAGAYARSLWASLEDPGRVVTEAIHDQYAKLFAALTAPTYAIPGNVDAPELWPDHLHDGVTLADGRVLEIGGVRFGFVGGTVLPKGRARRSGGVWKPYIRTAEDYDADVAALHGVDVLCTHCPPALPELTYDVVARRAELGSTALVDLLDRESPRYALFGHVHQPLAPRLRYRRTECINVGHFQRTETPYVLEL